MNTMSWQLHGALADLFRDCHRPPVASTHAKPRKSRQTREPREGSSCAATFVHASAIRTTGSPDRQTQENEERESQLCLCFSEWHGPCRPPRPPRWPARSPGLRHHATTPRPGSCVFSGFATSTRTQAGKEIFAFLNACAAASHSPHLQTAFMKTLSQTPSMTQIRGVEHCSNQRHCTLQRTASSRRLLETEATRFNAGAASTFDPACRCLYASWTPGPTCSARGNERDGCRA